MAIENKQNLIINELVKRLETGFYADKLPKGLDLAEEFKVNSKTINKAITKLVDKGLVYRKPGRGTFIVKEKSCLQDFLIELLFVGSSEITAHPFYSEMWRGIIDSITPSGFKLVLNMLQEDTRRGGIKNVCNDLIPSAGKILIGTNNAAQVKALKRSKVPFVLAGSKVPDPEVISVYADCTSAFEDAISYLRQMGAKDIAYVGLTQDDGEHLLDLEKFHTYLTAVQRGGKLESDLIENTPPFACLGYSSMKKILSRKIPDAILVAYDHLAAGVYQAINESGLKVGTDISVVGIDGLNSAVSPELTSIPIDRYAIGVKAGKLITDMIRNPVRGKHCSIVLEAEFKPESGSSIV